MIRTDTSGQPLISLGRADSLSRLLVPGSVVRVDILGSRDGRGMLIRIAGHILAAAGLSGHAEGESFRARVRLADNTVFLHPLPADSAALPADLLDRLGVDSTASAAFLVAFFQKIGSRLDGRTINSLARLSSRFPGREQRAAEAAAILAERGIEPAIETVERLLGCLEGRSGATDEEGGNADKKNGSDGDFLAFVNQKKGHDRHWIILPFKRDLAGCPCSGSIRFLLDVATGSCIDSRVTCITGSNDWDFALTDTSCSFTANPPFKSVVFDKFVVYLKSILYTLGISDVKWKHPDKTEQPLAGPVDVEI